MAKYRKKPVIVDAFRWTGDRDQIEDPEWIVEAIKSGKVRFSEDGESLFVVTLEGILMANQGDYIIRGIQGEIYPCKPDIFEATYERVEEEVV
jgi:hypothetical protein